MKANYSVSIIETSKQLTAKERIALKDTTAAIKLDEATKEAPVIINPGFYGVLGIHNVKADPQDYENYVIVDAETGDKYITGSESFWNSFLEIAAEMQGEDEAWSIKVYRLPSKNYAGRDFLTCSII